MTGRDHTHRTAESELLLAIYGGVTSDDAFKRMLELLAERFACRSAALFYVAKNKTGADITIAHGTIGEPYVVQRYQQKYAALDPAPGLLARLPLGEVTSTDQVYTESDLIAFSQFLNGFYYPIGLGGALGGPIANGDGQIGMVAVQRPLARAPFTHDDAQSFRALMPHLIQAITLRSAFFRVSANLQSLEQSCEAVPMGMLVFDDSGRLDSANLSARRILGRRDGLSLDRTGRLRADDAKADRKLRGLLDGNKSTSLAQVLLVPRRDAVAPYGLRILRRPPRPEFTSVLLSEPGRDAPAAAQLLSTLFDITEAPARLAAALVEGVTLDEYAARTGISINTAKFHLKALFQSMGVNRQADMIRLASVLVNDLT